MEMILDEAEVRILGCLIEKEITTPEYYPLSLNALTNACSQKSNRNPVVSYGEAAVERGLEGLLEKGLVRRTHIAGSRVPKYVHTLPDRFDLSGQEIAVLCELLLRGPQTAGEIRARAERMCAFKNLEQVEETLEGLMEHDPSLVTRPPREAGRKESRYMHLLSGGVERTHDLAVEPEAPHAPVQGRIDIMEEEIAKLRSELEELKRAFAEFKAQF